jgi:antitoxin HicB
MPTKRKNPRSGTKLNSWLAEEGVLEELRVEAIKEVLALQIYNLMAECKLSKTKMAKSMGTSRPQLDRLLDPKNGNVTVVTLQKAASALGKDLRIELT